MPDGPVFHGWDSPGRFRGRGRGSGTFQRKIFCCGIEYLMTAAWVDLIEPSDVVQSGYWQRVFTYQGAECVQCTHCKSDLLEMRLLQSEESRTERIQDKKNVGKRYEQRAEEKRRTWNYKRLRQYPESSKVLPAEMASR